MPRPLQVRLLPQGAEPTNQAPCDLTRLSSNSYETFPRLTAELFDRPQDPLRAPTRGSAPSSPAPRRTKQVAGLVLTRFWSNKVQTALMERFL